MRLLIISYGIKFTGACLMAGGKAASHKIEEGYSPDFPKNAVEYVLQEAELNIGAVDYIAFLGKPLSYFERLINIHTRSFPFSFLKFFSDFRDFFSNKVAIRRAIKKNLNFNKDICYVEPADAIAHQVAKDGGDQ